MTSRPGAGGWLHRLTIFGVSALVLLIVSAGTFALVVRYTELFELLPSSVPPAALARFHTGTTLCLRYSTAPDARSLDEAVLALAGSGLETKEFFELFGDLRARAARLEAAHHSKVEVDEYLETMGERGDLLARVALVLKRDLLRQRLKFWTTFMTGTTRTIASLPEARRAALEAQWARDPSLFVYPGNFLLKDLLAAEVTSRRLDRVQLMLEARAHDGGELDLESVGIPRAARSDEWFGTFELERGRDAGLVLMSLGHDGKRGGLGLDADLVRVIRETKKAEAQK